MLYPRSLHRRLWAFARDRRAGRRRRLQVIVTADIGIKSHAEARLARELGIDLIICDHHLPDGEDVPAEAFAVLCPKGSSGVDYPNKHLAACGVSLKLADALLTATPSVTPILASLAKLTAIGTIADMVDLSANENRAIVAHGLQSAQSNAAIIRACARCCDCPRSAIRSRPTMSASRSVRASTPPAASRTPIRSWRCSMRKRTRRRRSWRSSSTRSIPNGSIFNTS